MDISGGYDKQRIRAVGESERKITFGNDSLMHRISRAISGVFSKKDTEPVVLKSISKSSIDSGIVRAQVSDSHAELGEMLDQFFKEKVVPEIQRSWERIKKEAIYPIENLEQEIEKAREIFKNAVGASFPFIILGNGAVWLDSHLMGNVGILAAEPEPTKVDKLRRESFDTVRSLSQGSLSPMIRGSALTESVIEEQFFKRGSILCDEKWSILRNDMIILGGIIGGKEFHLALANGKLPTEENLWDQKANRLRVFGREITMLYQAGYQLHELPDKQGLVFARGEETHIHTLQEIREFADTVTSVDQVLTMLSKLIKK